MGCRPTTAPALNLSQDADQVKTLIGFLARPNGFAALLPGLKSLDPGGAGARSQHSVRTAGSAAALAIL